MTLSDLAMYHFHRYSQCLCLESAKDFYKRGDEEMATFELLNWVMHMEEADHLYPAVSTHHASLYCQSRAYF